MDVGQTTPTFAAVLCMTAGVDMHTHDAELKARHPYASQARMTPCDLQCACRLLECQSHN